MAVTCVRSAGLIPANALETLWRQCYTTTWSCCQVRPLSAPCAAGGVCCQQGKSCSAGAGISSSGSGSGSAEPGGIQCCLALWDSDGDNPQVPWQHPLCPSCHSPVPGMAEHALARMAATWSFAVRTWLPDF